jgi:hypothetical protein
MFPIAAAIRHRGGFARRRDLLALGFGDRGIRFELGHRQIFRVRHGWYSVPDAPEQAVRAVRVGGRLTGAAALESYGLRVPRRQWIDVAVPRNACRLRHPLDRRSRITNADGIRTLWVDPQRNRLGSAPWRVSVDDALLLVLETESREIAVACASAVMRHLDFSPGRMDAVFARAPQHARHWRGLVSGLDDSHGETFARLWVMDAGLPWESQARFPGVGRLDGRVSPNVYVEIDGGQHDPRWTGESPSSYEHDHDRDTTVAIGGGTVLRFTYRQLYGDWARCLAAIQRARSDDLELIARRARHPVPRAVLRKRRSSASTSIANTGSRPP